MSVGNVPVVDTHHHFWDPGRAHYPWLAAGERAAIRRPFGPEDLRPVLAANGIDRTVVVEARASVEETHELLAMAEGYRFMAGVIGWADLTDPHLPNTLAGLRYGRGGEYLVGLRLRLREEPDEHWLVRGDVLHGLGILADAGLTVDLLLTPRELPAALEAARQMPRLTLVVDHLGAPAVERGEDPAWAAGMEALAAEPNAHCKLSGLTVAGSDRLAPFVERIRRWFGDERLVFGSDWPVCLLSGGYDQVVATFRELMRDASFHVRRSILGSNAISIYRLPNLG
jgi:L-fuconolactonase